MALNKSCLGKKYEQTTANVELEATKKYAISYNDDNPAFLDEKRAGGVIAPPMFGVVYSGGAMAQALFDEELNANMARLVHGEQDMNFKTPARPGDVITCNAHVATIEEKSTGEFFTVDVDCKNQKGEDVLTARFGFFIRGSKKDAAGKPPEAKPPEPVKQPIVYTQKMKVKPDQTYVYADASGDHNPIHIDVDFAKSVGLPGIILQGLCTMAFTQKAAVDMVCGKDPLKLKRLKVRFSKPVQPNDELVTEGWIIEKKNQSGDQVIKDGIAEVG
jgi:acyl dehydratase